MEGLMNFIAKEFGVTTEEIEGRSRGRDISEPRSALCYVCMSQFGVTEKRVSEALEMSPAAVSLASARGEAFVSRTDHFQKSLNLYLNNLSTSLSLTYVFCRTSHFRKSTSYLSAEKGPLAKAHESCKCLYDGIQEVNRWHWVRNCQYGSIGI